MIKFHHAVMLLVWGAAACLLYLNFRAYPIGNGRDEVDHLQLIQFYSTHHRFPTLPDDLAATSEQGHQPPLYYLALGRLLGWGLPSPESPTRYEPNPFLIMANFDPLIPPYNRVLWIHHWTGKAAPYIATVKLLRVVSALINLMGLAFVWRTVYVLFERGPARWIAPLTLAFLMLTPSYWRLAIIVSNTQLVFLWGAVITYLLGRALRDGLAWKRSAEIGVCLGLALLSKVYTFPLVIMVLVTYLLSDGVKNALRHLALVGGLTLIIAGWWYWRNYRLYGDFTASAIVEEILGSRRTAPATAGDVVTWLTRWSAQQWLETETILNTESSFTAASVIGSLLMGSGLAALARGRLRGALVKGGGWLLASAFGAALGFALIGAWRSLHAEYMPPLLLSGLPVISILFACGGLAWLPEKYWGRAAASSVLLIIAASALFQVTAFLPLFPPLERVAAGANLEVDHRLRIDFENGARLVGYELKDAVVQPGERSAVKLCWEATEAMDTRTLYAFTVKLILPDLPNAAAIDGYPLSGRYPTTAWQPNTTFCEWIPLLVSRKAVTPRAYQLLVGMYVLHGGNVHYRTPDGGRSDFLVLDRVTVLAPMRKKLPTPAVTVDDWGGLVDYDYGLEDGEFRLRLDWLARGATPASYHYYLHALNAAGEIVAQVDAPPLNGDFPTDYWRTGARFSETLRLTLPPETVRLKFGVYDPLTGVRGQWAADGQPVGDGLMLEIEG